MNLHTCAKFHKTGIKALFTALTLATMLVLLTASGCGNQSPSESTTVATTGTNTSATNTASTTAATPQTTPAAPASRTATASPAGASGGAQQATPPAAPAGPYTTMAAAEDFVQKPFVSNGVEHHLKTDSSIDSTIWRPNAVLHVILGMGGTADEGQWYFFFVNGNLVGTQAFNDSQYPPGLSGATGSSFPVNFTAYNPGDPTCCPSGGNRTVTFVWDGWQLNTQGSLLGATEQ